MFCLNENTRKGQILIIKRKVLYTHIIYFAYKLSIVFSNYLYWGARGSVVG
jgi:hypothetical protein